MHLLNILIFANYQESDQYNSVRLSEAELPAITQTSQGSAEIRGEGGLDLYLEQVMSSMLWQVYGARVGLPNRGEMWVGTFPIYIYTFTFVLFTFRNYFTLCKIVLCI